MIEPTVFDEAELGVYEELWDSARMLTEAETRALAARYSDSKPPEDRSVSSSSPSLPLSLPSSLPLSASSTSSATTTVLPSHWTRARVSTLTSTSEMKIYIYVKQILLSSDTEHY